MVLAVTLLALVQPSPVAASLLESMGRANKKGHHERKPKEKKLTAKELEDARQERHEQRLLKLEKRNAQWVEMVAERAQEHRKRLGKLRASAIRHDAEAIAKEELELLQQSYVDHNSTDTSEAARKRRHERKEKLKESALKKLELQQEVGMAWDKKFGSAHLAHHHHHHPKMLPGAREGSPRQRALARMQSGYTRGLPSLAGTKMDPG